MEVTSWILFVLHAGFQADRKPFTKMASSALNMSDHIRVCSLFANFTIVVTAFSSYSNQLYTRERLGSSESGFRRSLSERITTVYYSSNFLSFPPAATESWIIFSMKRFKLCGICAAFSLYVDSIGSLECWIYSILIVLVISTFAVRVFLLLVMWTVHVFARFLIFRSIWRKFTWRQCYACSI